MSRAFRETFQQIFIRRFVENSSSPWTSNKCTSNSTLGANRERKHSVNSASEKSKQLPDNQRADLESIRRTVCPSFLDERINGGHFDAPECSPKVAITNRNGLTQLATTADLANKPVHALANELFETMLWKKNEIESWTDKISSNHRCYSWALMIANSPEQRKTALGHAPLFVILKMRPLLTFKVIHCFCKIYNILLPKYL